MPRAKPVEISPERTRIKEYETTTTTGDRIVLHRNTNTDSDVYSDSLIKFSYPSTNHLTLESNYSQLSFFHLFSIILLNHKSTSQKICFFSSQQMRILLFCS